MRVLLPAIFLLLSTALFSQTKISGVVNDVNGESLPFVNVIFKDTNEGTITNEDGRFYLESDETQEAVVFSFIGFTPKEIALEKRATYGMEITLEEEAAALDEVDLPDGEARRHRERAMRASEHPKELRAQKKDRAPTR